MTTQDLFDRLAALGCRLTVTVTGSVKAMGPVHLIDPELRTILHEAREALAVAVLRQHAEELGTYLDGSAPYAERLRRVPEYSRFLDRLSSAQERLYATWKEKGWVVGWDSKNEVFTLTGSGPAPIGAENYEVHTLEEVF